MPILFYTILFLTTHLLLEAFLRLLLQRTETQQFYLARAGAGLAGLLLAWVGVLLMWRRQWQWVGAGALALLLWPMGWPCVGACC